MEELKMMNWHIDKQEIVQKTVNAVYDELEILVDVNYPISANYWIDDRHNVFAETRRDNDGNNWISFYYELSDINGDIIADIHIMDTEDRSPESLKKGIIKIVNGYYGE